MRVLGAGSRVWVQSPPSLALSFLWLCPIDRDHHEHWASLSPVSTLGFSWALGPGPHPPHRLAHEGPSCEPPPHALLVA